MKARSRKDFKRKRHARIRKKVKGTAERPRMAIMVSNRNMYVQFIDDSRGVTLAAATTAKGDTKCTVDVAKDLGRRAAESAMSKGITNMVVDRGGFKFHGRVKAIVDGALEAGLSTEGNGGVRVAEPADAASDESENGKEEK